MGSAAVMTALDGATVYLSADRELQEIGTTSFAVFDIGGHLQEFGGGPHDFGDIEASRRGVTFEQEYASQGGRLRIGSAQRRTPTGFPLPPVRLAAWQGQAHSVKTVIYGGTPRDLIGLLSSFSIGETPNGVTVRPRSPEQATLVRTTAHAPDIARPVPGIGLLDISELTPDVAAQVPAWKGRLVAGGEVFVESPRTDEMTLVFVGESVFIRIYPNAGVSERELLQFVASLSGRWVPQTA
jgi:hypothetical protein